MSTPTPEGWQKCRSSIEYADGATDAPFSGECCKAEEVPHWYGYFHAGPCCSDPECEDCSERLVRERS